MAKLAIVDQAFLQLETDQRPMNAGCLIVLKPPKDQRRGYAKKLVREALKRPVGPPFNYVVKPGRIPITFDIDERDDVDPSKHVFLERVREPGDLETLFAQVCDVHIRHLPRNAPLWQMHVFDGLPDGRVALYFKFHHGILDGLGFLRVINPLISRSPKGQKHRAIWEGLPPSTGDGELPADRLSSAVNALQELRTTANDLVRIAWHQGLRSFGLGHGLMSPFVTTPDVMDSEPSPHRIMGHCVLSLPRMLDLAHANGAKVNDVILTVLDLAMTRYLEEHGRLPDRPLVTDIPIALDDHGGAGNRITILQVGMGRPGHTPAERLRDVVRETTELKREVREISGNALMIYSMMMHTVASAMETLGLRDAPMLANTVISNPFGLRERMYFNGAAVELALPVSVVPHHQVLNITATTYVDDVHVTFIAVREVMPDLQVLADYTTQALDILEADLKAKHSHARKSTRTGRSRTGRRAKPATARKSGRRVATVTA
jgi:WS/DGAT/MGAT family acyltransferase